MQKLGFRLEKHLVVARPGVFLGVYKGRSVLLLLIFLNDVMVVVREPLRVQLEVLLLVFVCVLGLLCVDGHEVALLEALIVMILGGGALFLGFLVFVGDALLHSFMRSQNFMLC